MSVDFGGGVDRSAARVASACAPDLHRLCLGVVDELRPHCQSEIECIFGATLLSIGILFAAHQRRLPLLKLCLPSDAAGADPKANILIPQYPWREYRIDWALRIGDTDLIFIECDGHDFHERTKEQAARDRSRDRTIQSAGIPIFRFTGSEIWASPARCVDEVMNFAAGRLPKKEAAP